MRFSFELVSISIEVEYRNVKTLRLTIYPPDGKVLIAAPFGTSPEYIKKFAASKIEWIKANREKLIKKPSDSIKAAASLKNNTVVHVWGVPYKLELIVRRGHPKIIIEDDSMKMYIRPDSARAKRQEFLDKWYRNTLKESAPDIIAKWETKLGIQVNKLYVRKMKSHWGSCNREKRTLRLNSELAKRDPECLEYVIVHEMVHIFEKGHNEKFYRLLGKYLPEWKAIRKKLNAGV